MGLFSGKNDSGDTGRTSAQGGNGNVRDSRGEHQHSSVETPNLKAIHDLHWGTADYRGKHCAS